jgi:hypothetical protein
LQPRGQREIRAPRAAGATARDRIATKLSGFSAKKLRAPSGERFMESCRP